MADNDSKDFIMEWDGTISYERTNNKDEALESNKYYYISGDTLILRKETYIRKQIYEYNRNRGGMNKQC